MVRITVKGGFVTTVSWMHLMHYVTNLTHEGPAGSPEQRELAVAAATSACKGLTCCCLRAGTRTSSSETRLLSVVLY
jgi:hypothetical protein